MTVFDTYLTMTFVSVFPHQVHAVTVLVPEGSLIGQGAVGDGGVVVVVEGGEGPSVVVAEGVPWWRKHIITRY